ncbi:alpha/beta hydrolase (plasmid) [Niallia circulans]|uniref:Alpha/beta hydrolase n=1 Tax=Niallia circulans TaxID=1397 RepID=A0A553SQF4_NIACI|nr:alpha/beta hydrolase [Niallia circulans]TRZ39224.1 alpha/beta hydrolase [Niallia circulans]
MTKYFKIKVNNEQIFYREAGDKNNPTLLLLHGFPSASHMFRDLIPELEHHFHIIAPDYPGFGNSSSPSREQFEYTFHNISTIIESFLEVLEINQYYMFVFDYGAPIGFRMALRKPEKILGIVSQNGNIYEEGLGPKWETRKDFWKNPTNEKRDSYRTAFSRETIIGQYTEGTKEGSVSPDGYTLDIAYTHNEDYANKQLDLIYDYQNNVKMYPDFQRYLRENQPKLLAVWGKNDPSFIYPGAEAFKKDVKNAVVHLVDSGHFALETHYKEIGKLIRESFK